MALIPFSKKKEGISLHFYNNDEPDDWTMKLARIKPLLSFTGPTEQVMGIGSVNELCKILIELCCSGEKVLKIRHLILEGHGNEFGFSIGKDKITLETFHKYSFHFLSLMPLFTRDAVITLDQCETGNEEELLKMVSNAFGGVTVKAYTGETRVIRPNAPGKWVTCVLNKCSS
ncbi:MAG: hypothetical protein R2747_15375 [Pyrinomonadaceae bacterium]